jgi:hypothetical protein
MWQKQLAFKSYLKVLSFTSSFCSFLHSKSPSSQLNPTHIIIIHHTWIDNKVHELLVKVLHTLLLITTVVTFKVLPLGSYAPMPAPSAPFKTILEQVLWNGLQSCRCITPDVTSIIKLPSFQYFLHLPEQKKVSGG